MQKPRTKFIAMTVACLAGGMVYADSYYPEGYHPDGTACSVGYSAATSFCADASTAKAAPSGKGGDSPTLLFRNGESCEGRKVAVYRIPALASWPDGSLVAVTDARYDDYRDLSDGHPICIACRWSSDGGKSWSVPSILWNCPWNDTEKWAASDPSLIADERSGAVFCFVNVMEHVGKQGPFYRHFVQRSDDKGKTWGAPTEITKSIRLPHWNAEEYALIPAGSGFQLRDGTLVHTIVCGGQVSLFGSSDGGDTWKPIGKPAPGGDECKVVELDDGTLLIDERVDRRMSGRRIHVSHDRGQTWETRLDKTLPDPSCNAGLNVLPVGGRNLLAFSNCASYTFRANDRNPQRKEFNSGFNWGIGLCDKNVLPCGPHLTFGVHSWQSDAGLRELGDFVEKISGREDIWYVNENTYAASRIQSLNTCIRKVKVRGNNVLFEVVRPQPYALGAAVDLFMSFTESPQGIMLEGKPIAADRQICLTAPEGVPTRFALIPDALRVDADLQTFHADFVNRESDTLSDVRFFLRLPPGYEPGVLEDAKGRIAPGERVTLRWTAVRPTDPTLRAGNLYAALEVDARLAKERVRYWATLLKRRSHEPFAVPRDNASVCGPLKEDETPSENQLMRLSMPETALVDVGITRFQRWRHAVADTSEAEYAVTIPSSDEGVQVRKDMQLKKDARIILLAFEFTANQREESPLWRLVFKAQNDWLSADGLGKRRTLPAVDDRAAGAYLHG